MISIGLDVGKSTDPAALAVLHAGVLREGSHRPRWSVAEVGNIPLGTSYEQLAIIACSLAGDFAAAGYPVVVTIDATGIGDAVLEHARKLYPDLHIVGVKIGKGMVLAQNNPDEYTVGKHRLTEVLQVVLEAHALELPDTEGGRAAREQMRDFVRKVTASGYAKHEARGSGHDDLVLCLELAVWTGDTMYDQQAGVAL